MPPDPDSPVRRRGRRRDETAAEIQAHALEIMAVDGVGGLTIASLARRMGVRSPSVYKHVESLMAVYDGLFRRGQVENLSAFTGAVAGRSPGLDSLAAGLEATARWAFANPVLAELLFWRPVPGYTPTPEALAPAEQIVLLLQRDLTAAVDRGQLSSGAATGEGLALLAAVHFGVISQHLANEPGVGWAESRFAQVHGRTTELLVAAYPPSS